MKFRNSKAFALPAVLISSIVMLIVMLSAVTSTVAVRVSLDSQYYNQLSRIAGDAGTAYAKACLAQNGGVAKWSDTKPLMPNTDCSGDQLAGFTCTEANQLTEPRCSVMVTDSNTVASFSVAAPTVDLSGKSINTNSVGVIKKIKNSSGEVWRQYSSVSKSAKTAIRSFSYAGIKQLSAGNNHTCAIASNDKAYCWGYNSDGQIGDDSSVNSNVPVAVATSGVLSGKTITSIASGSTHSCAIDSEGKAYCWGDNTYKQLGNGSPNSSNSPVAVVMTGVLSGKTLKSMSSGGSTTCAIASDNQAYCWGTYRLGSSITASDVPIAVDTSGALSGKILKSISVSEGAVCVIADDNLAYCWGANNYGQFGNNTSTNSDIPVLSANTGALTGKTIKSISTGTFHTCAISSEDLVYCWGNNNYGQSGNNSLVKNITPAAVVRTGVLSGKTIKSISAGDYHTCAVANDDKSYCWGRGTSGELGNGASLDSKVPVATQNSGVLNGKSLQSIYSGQGYACAIVSDSLAYCWGDDGSGQLGDGHDSVTYNTPVALSTKGPLSGKDVKAITAAGSSSCAITVDNQAYCWGSGSLGTIGNGIALETNKYPFAVKSSNYLNNKTIKSISTGSGHNCAIANDDLAYCWGYNTYGQVGDNSASDKTEPVPVYTSGLLSGKTIKQISAGSTHTCAVANDNKAYCWGNNANSLKLGGAGGTYQIAPVAVSTAGVLNGKNLTSISAGSSSTCAIADDNQAYCWGINTNGALGNNTTSSDGLPVAVYNSGSLYNKTVKSISVGNDYACVIASDNKIYCWGDNTNGKLGNNSTTRSLVPTPVYTGGVLNNKTILSISAGNNSACVIASDNQVYCWGANGSGEFGNNTKTRSLVPVAVDTNGFFNNKTVISVDVGEYHTCAISSDNQGYCWGYSSYGCLGNNTIAESLTPYPILKDFFYNATINDLEVNYNY